LPSREKQIGCVTLGSRGVLAAIDGNTSIVAGRKVKAVDTTGAGDCLVGALAAQLARGKPIHDALAYANAAASTFKIQRLGNEAGLPTLVDIAKVRHEFEVRV
ncbi:MAG: PfkB family carbohydrate kinase, partial [Bradyrhizobium guangdongense]